MRLLLLALCLASAGVTLAGCGGSASVPAPPAGVKSGPPPGTSPEMLPDPKKMEQRDIEQKRRDSKKK